MTAFSPSKNALSASIKRDFHSYSEASVRKGSKSPNDKRILKSKVSSIIDDIDLADFGIRVVILKTIQ
jgi:hypothetical protein